MASFCPVIVPRMRVQPQGQMHNLSPERHVVLISCIPEARFPRMLLGRMALQPHRVRLTLPYARTSLTHHTPTVFIAMDASDFSDPRRSRNFTIRKRGECFWGEDAEGHLSNSIGRPSRATRLAGKHAPLRTRRQRQRRQFKQCPNRYCSQWLRARGHTLFWLIASASAPSTKPCRDSLDASETVRTMNVR